MAFIVSFHYWINVLPSSGETLNLMEYNRTVKKRIECNYVLFPVYKINKGLQINIQYIPPNFNITY